MGRMFLVDHAGLQMVFPMLAWLTQDSWLQGSEAGPDRSSGALFVWHSF